MKTVFDINDYKEASKFLQDKYDALGYTRESYYRLDDAGNFTLGRTGKLQKNDVGHGNVGLQYHHIWTAVTCCPISASIDRSIC